MRIQGILLAAGASRRFGSNKLLMELGGEPLVVRAALNLCAAGVPVHCVVRDSAGPVAQALGGIPGVAIGACPDAHLGMGRSLAWGVAATPSADAWLVALGDMPEVAPDTIRSLIRALRAHAPLVAPEFGGRRGHPVGFSRRWYAQLLALDGDRGARDLLAAHPLELQQIRVQDPGVLLDLDYPEDLARLTP